MWGQLLCALLVAVSSAASLPRPDEGTPFAATLPEGRLSGSPSPFEGRHPGPSTPGNASRTHKHVYFYSIPDNAVRDSESRLGQAPPEAHYKIIFIKFPESDVVGGGAWTYPIARPQVQTLVYLLQPVVHVSVPPAYALAPSPPQAAASPPSVFYVDHQQRQQQQQLPLQQGSHAAPDRLTPPEWNYYEGPGQVATDSSAKTVLPYGTLHYNHLEGRPQQPYANY